MPKFSTKSLNQLFTCHQDLQTLFNEVIKTFDCTVLEGFRNEENQNRAFANGNSKLKWPNGNHNKSPSVAVDVIPYPVDWNDEKRHHFFAGFVMATAMRLKEQGKMTHDVRWGGSWNGFDKLNKSGMLNDLVHFELLS